MIALVHSEVSEALEDYRNGRKPNAVWYEYQDATHGKVKSSEPEEWVVVNNYTQGKRLEKGKPCGIPSELADVCIRIFDIAGRYGWGDELEKQNSAFQGVGDQYKGFSFAEKLTCVHSDLSQSYLQHRQVNMKNAVYCLAGVLYSIGFIAEEHGIDLDQAIAEKISYNATRPQRHGGKTL